VRARGYAGSGLAAQRHGEGAGKRLLFGSVGSAGTNPVKHGPANVPTHTTPSRCPADVRPGRVQERRDSESLDGQPIMVRDDSEAKDDNKVAVGWAAWVCPSKLAA
jgi:hypothetical protein